MPAQASGSTSGAAKPAEAPAATGSRAAGLSNTWGRPYTPPRSSAPASSGTGEVRTGGLRVESNPDPELASAKRFRKQVTHSDQQNEVIHCPAKVIVVNALAGSGKTTTAVGYADARPNNSMIYIAFNKGIQLEASERFGPNVTCRTTHSLAFSAVGSQYSKAGRLARPWRAFTLRGDAGIPSIREAALVHSILLGYFQSASPEIGLEHGLAAVEEFKAEEYELHDAVATAKKVWVRMQDRGDRVSIPDDAYLKMWALSKPKLPYEHIIFDEAQDSNPVIEAVVRAQKHAHILYIGDRHQSIYAFRGSHNAMDGFDDTAKQLYLSQTWRFGPKVAKVANLLLAELKGEKVLIEGMGQDAAYTKGATVAKLARTNAQLFKEAALCRGEGINWVGGSEKYRVDRILDAYNLYAGRRSDIRDPMLRQFSSWAEMQGYADEAKDRELKIMTDVVSEYRKETPALVADIKRNEVPYAANARVVLTTAHSSKGLEFDFVQIADDFEILADIEAVLALDPHAAVDEQEINLLYVAVTRAKKMLHLNEDTIQWMEKLPEHRAARDRASRKACRNVPSSS